MYVMLLSFVFVVFVTCEIGKTNDVNIELSVHHLSSCFLFSSQIVYHCEVILCLCYFCIVLASVLRSNGFLGAFVL